MKSIVVCNEKKDEIYGKNEDYEKRSPCKVSSCTGEEAGMSCSFRKVNEGGNREHTGKEAKKIFAL